MSVFLIIPNSEDDAFCPIEAEDIRLTAIVFARHRLLNVLVFRFLYQSFLLVVFAVRFVDLLLSGKGRLMRDAVGDAGEKSRPAQNL